MKKEEIERKIKTLKKIIVIQKKQIEDNESYLRKLQNKLKEDSIWKKSYLFY